jgi:SAM-dependent methyltransferase
VSDERSSSLPTPTGSSVPPAPVDAPGQASPPNQVPSVSPERVRLPSIPGLVPPRIPGRSPSDGANLRSTTPSAEPQGLMRPHLPIRKPIPLPIPSGLADPDAAAAANGDSSGDESKIFSGHPILPNSTPRRLVPPPKPPMVPGPTAAANSSGTGMAPRRRATPAPHNVATITAMRIISIGVEDRPPPSEFSPRPFGSAPDLDIEPEREDEVTDRAPPPAQEIPEQYELPAQSFAASFPAIEDNNAEVQARIGPLEALPAFELSEPIEPPEQSEQLEQSALAPLPAFDMPESESAEPEEASTLPLPAFDMPEPDLQPQESAIAPLPEFEILRPVDAPQDLELVPLAAQAEQDFEYEQPPPLPVHAPVEPVELEEDDVAPDSIEPGPPDPPSRLQAPPREMAPEPVKLEPPAPPSRSAAALIAAPPPLPAPVEAPPPAPESSEAGPATKRNPPPPPRRSFPAPGEVLAATGAEPAQPISVAAAPASQELKSEEKAASRARRPWWEELFNEDYSRALSRLSDEQIKREASFIEESLGVAQGGALLDLGCGPGYHAVELAERGYAVVGYDLSLHQLALAADVAQERHQKLNLMQGDMREMAFDAVFDGIYCWNTTFGYFEEEKNLAVAENIFKALKPGGTFLVDVINRDFVTMQQPSSVWFEGDAAVCMDDMTVDFISSRLRVKRSVMLDDGRTRECPYSIRLYSLHELGKLLHDVGFRVAEASGDPSMPGVFMGQNAPRIIILAQRP